MNQSVKKIVNIFCVINAVVLLFIFGLVLASVIISATLKSKFSDLDYTIKKLPHKYAPLYDQPHTIQGDRGTCWAHGLVSGLAHSYRRNGVKKGYLADNEYVPFSVQAFAISMIKTCQWPKYNESVCRELQAGPEINSTSGGEVAWLYYMPEMYDKLYPLSMCSYTDTDSTEWICTNNHTADGSLESAIEHANNPIRFNITGMTTTYSNEDTKKKMFESELAAPISIDVWMNHFYIPCSTTDGYDYSSDTDYSYLCQSHNVSELVVCPSGITKIDSADKCLKVDQPGYNLDGEWYQTTPYTIEGGHCMMIQSYNDEYVSKNGDKGGFAIKNSWYDLVYDPTGSRGGRGSHSQQYYMNEISEQEERFICPNAHNPDNWVSCSDYSTQEAGAEVPSVNWCVSNATRMQEEVEWNRRPMAFQNYHYTDTPDEDTNYYYLDTYVHNTDGTVTATMVAVAKTATDDTDRSLVTIRSVPPGYLAWYFQPIDDQNKTLQNDADNCGVYWLPYSCNQNTARDQDTWNACFFDIDWADSSYLANKGDYSQYDYAYLEKSQTTRKTWSWKGPIARAMPDDSNPDPNDNVGDDATAYYSYQWAN